MLYPTVSIIDLPITQEETAIMFPAEGTVDKDKAAEVIVNILATSRLVLTEIKFEVSLQQPRHISAVVRVIRGTDAS